MLPASKTGATVQLLEWLLNVVAAYIIIHGSIHLLFFFIYLSIKLSFDIYLLWIINLFTWCKQISPILFVLLALIIPLLYIGLGWISLNLLIFKLLDLVQFNLLVVLLNFFNLAIVLRYNLIILFIAIVSNHLIWFDVIWGKLVFLWILAGIIYFSLFNRFSLLLRFEFSIISLWVLTWVTLCLNFHLFWPFP